MNEQDLINSADFLNKTVFENLNQQNEKIRSLIEKRLKEYLNTVLFQLSSNYHSPNVLGLIDKIDMSLLIRNSQGHKQSSLIKNQRLSNITNQSKNEKKLIEDLLNDEAILNLLNLNQLSKDHFIFNNESKRLTLKYLLNTSSFLKSHKIIDIFLDSYFKNNEITDQKFWKELQKRKEFKKPQIIEEIQFTLELSKFAKNNLILVENLQNLRKIGQIKHISDLAKLEFEDWKKMLADKKVDSDGKTAFSISKDIEGNNIEENIENNINILQSNTQITFPTAVFFRKLEKDDNIKKIDWDSIKSFEEEKIGDGPSSRNIKKSKRKNNHKKRHSAQSIKESLKLLQNEKSLFPNFDYKTSIKIDSKPKNKIREDVLTFFSNSPDFDLRVTSIDSYCDKKRSCFNGITGKTRQLHVKNQLKRFQRVFRLSPNYQDINTLLADDFDSSYAISKMSSNAFTKRYKNKLGGERKAREIHSQAKHMSATSLMLLTKYSPKFNNLFPKSLEISHDRIEGIKEIPNWEYLFGSLDTCECEHCKSVYSPSSYFVSLLQFLKNIPPVNNNGKKPFDILMERRPDLKFIELSCDNTNKLIPYIDIVNEILERYVISSNFLPQPIFLWNAIITDYIIKGEGNNDNEKLASFIKEKFSLDLRGFKITKKDDDSNNTTISVIEIKKAIDLIDPSFEIKIFLNKELTNAQSIIRKNNKIIDTYEFTVINSRNNAIVYPSLNIKSEATTEELNANPEYTNSKAYDRLKDQNVVYPFGLPFNLWVEEVRRYLLHLESTLYKVLTTFTKGDQQSEKYPFLDISIATEYLGIIKEEKTIITTNDPQFLWQYYGFKSENDEDGTSWKELLKKVPILLKKLNLTYTELIDLLQSLSINYEKDVTIKTEDTSCNLDKASLNSLNDPNFLLIYRIVRLWKKLEISLEELDRIIFLLNDKRIDDNLLIKLAYIKKIQRDLNLPITNVMPFWNAKAWALYHKENFDKSLYKKIFLNKSVSNPPEIIFELDNIESVNKIELKTPNKKITDYISSLLAAFSISLSDILELLEFLNNNKFISNDNNLNLYNLAIIYRYVTLSKSLNINVSDLLSLIYIIGIDPFQDNLIDRNIVNEESLRRIIQTTTFIDKFQKIKQAGFSIQELNYLLNHKSDDDSKSIFPKNDAISLFLTEIRDGLKKIAIETNIIGLEGSEENLQRKLSIIYTQMEVNEVVSIIQGKKEFEESLNLDSLSFEFSNELKERISFDSQHHLLKYKGIMTTKTKNDLLSLVSEDDEEEEAQKYKQAIISLFEKSRFIFTTWLDDKLLDSFASKVENESKFEIVLKLLFDYIRKEVSQNFVKQKFSEYLKVESSVVDILLRNLLKSRIDLTKPKPIISDYFEDAFVNSETNDITTPEFKAQFNAFYLIDKSALIIKKFKIDVNELEYLHDNKIDFDDFDLNNILIDNEEGTTISFNSKFRFQHIERLISLFSLRDKLKNDRSNLFDIFKASKINTDDLSEEVQRLQMIESIVINMDKWNTEDIGYLLGTRPQFMSPSPLALTSSSFNNEKGMIKLTNCLDLVNQLNLSAKNIINMIYKNNELTNDISSTDYLNIKNALKAKYGNENWLTVIKPLMDEIRNKRRNALTLYILYKDKYENINQLYEKFLIDIEMSPCQTTSRILQSISTVQLFIQRSLMNLEEGIHLDEDSVKRWEWMKRYRVWEANRKVFLYPENWIEPELRDNKTPFFKELEYELLQEEVNDRSVENSLTKYLEKLDSIANMEICGLYCEQWNSEDPKDVVHVIARTFGNPQLYYYRKFVTSEYWTSWEKIDVDIEGEHIMPVVYNRRLLIYWPIFEEREKEEKGATDGKLYPYLEIKLAWTEYLNGKWSAKSVSSLSNDNYDSQGFGYPQAKWSHILTFKWLMNMFSIRKEGIGEFLSIVQQNEPRIRFYNFTATFMNRNVGEFRILDTKGDIEPFTVYKNQGNSYEESKAYDLTFHDIYCILIPTPKCNRISSHLRRSLHPNFNNNIMELYTDFTAPPLGWEGNSDQILKTSIIFNKIFGKYNIFYPHQFEQFLCHVPFFYQDNYNTFYVKPRVLSNGLPYSVPSDVTQILKMEMPDFSFQLFDHPYTHHFIKQLDRNGISGLLNFENQQLTDKDEVTELTDFQRDYAPDESKITLLPSGIRAIPEKNIDFTISSSYSIYNWELFFHIPLLIATRLSKNQKFEESQKWFHYIFDPTKGNKEYWRFLPFVSNEIPKSIEEIMKLINENDQEFVKQVKEWLENPFNPHLIARMRIGAYQKTVVMKYLDNLINWADNLFRQDKPETINEATLLYILGYEILGRRPILVQNKGKTTINTFYTLEKKLDEFGNALVELENQFPFSSSIITDSIHEDHATDDLINGSILYFCIPRNDQLLENWNRVEDRLLKIRSCQNIEGITRQLPLFEPPIDPGMLVKATAMGIDISSALNDISAAIPHYRFSFMIQKAIDLTNDVKSLGNLLLSNLEKRDSEELTQLRSFQEVNILNSIKDIKKQQIEEIEYTIDALKENLDALTIRNKHYKRLSNEFMNTNEKLHIEMMLLSWFLQTSGQIMEIAAAGAHAIPDFSFGVSGLGPEATTKIGGSHIGNALDAFGKAFGFFSSFTNLIGSMSLTMAGYQRRAEEWKLQEEVSSKEVDQINKQIQSAEIRKQIAENELKNHEKQIENAVQVELWMKEKFTNKELYAWMVSQISTIYFQSYQLAYDFAKRAEQSYKHELGIENSSFITFGYWDSLKKGLMAGERLYFDLKRLESSYIDKNRREYEITRIISLAMINPEALIELREKGTCDFELKELLFDLDYPGHYMRRIKNVSITIPSIVGPYTSINSTLTLLNNKIRINNNANNAANYENDENFSNRFGAISSIATSNAQNDSGLFELNFKDERYLPFEGSGVISTWRLEMPKEFNNFDFDTISDIIIKVSYTSREGGERFRGISKQFITGKIETEGNFMRMFSSKHEYPNQWHSFIHINNKQDLLHQLDIDFIDRFPYLFERNTIQINKMSFFLKLNNEIKYDNKHPLKMVLSIRQSDGSDLESEASLLISDNVKFGNLAYHILELNNTITPGKVTLKVERNKDKIPPYLRQKVKNEAGNNIDEETTIDGKNYIQLSNSVMDNIGIICYYSIKEKNE